MAVARFHPSPFILLLIFVKTSKCIDVSTNLFCSESPYCCHTMQMLVALTFNFGILLQMGETFLLCLLFSANCLISVFISHMRIDEPTSCILSTHKQYNRLPMGKCPIPLHYTSIKSVGVNCFKI